MNINITELELTNLSFFVDKEPTIAGEAKYKFIVEIDGKEYKGTYSTYNYEFKSNIPKELEEVIKDKMINKIDDELLDCLNKLLPSL